jgi:hypothetical protein
MLWPVATALPAFFHFAFAATKFPWPLILPLSLFGPLLASNRRLTQALGESTDARNPK